MTYVLVFLLLVLIGIPSYVGAADAWWFPADKALLSGSLSPQDVSWLEAQCVRVGLPPSAWK